MFSHPDFHSYVETDASVRLELHCKTLLPSKFVTEKIFLTYKTAINCSRVSATNSKFFTKSLRETIDRYDLELATLFT